MQKPHYSPGGSEKGSLLYMTPSGTDGKTLFVTDLDGTLLDDDKGISESDLKSLQCLQKAGFVTAIATGRSLYSFNKLLARLGLRGPESPFAIHYVIFSTGAGIMEFPSEKILFFRSLSRRDVIRASAFLETLGLDYMVHRPVPNTREFVYRYLSGHNPDFLTRIQMYNHFGSPAGTADLLDFGEATEVLCIIPASDAGRLVERIAAALPGINVIRATSPLDHRSVWVEIFPDSVSKSQTVCHLAESLCIRQREVWAVGNDYNDEDMLHWAGHAFAVANSVRGLIEQFDAVPSNNHSGVSEVAAKMLTTWTP